MAAAAYPIPLTAAQIGTYFVGQYYHALQQQPEIVHQFYSDSSTMLRIDGNSRETATGMLILYFQHSRVIQNESVSEKSVVFLVIRQIHTLIMSVCYTGVEIKTIFSLESWNGGVLVMISGSVQPKNLNGCWKFAQTFFLAPQENGFFILNDIFHLIEEDHPHQLPPVFLAQHNLSAKDNSPHSNQEPVPTFMVGGEIQAKDSSQSDIKENGQVDNCGVAERRQQAREFENGSCAVESNSPAQRGGNDAADNLPTSASDSVGEPPKRTYASILRVAKGQGPPSLASPLLAAKSIQTSPEWDPIPEPQQSIQSSNEYERAGAEPEDVSAVEEEGEIKSVYVRNLPPSVSESEVEQEFEKFGKIRPNGMVIRVRKDLGVCYAFVEFEDMGGVTNAVKAGSAHIGGREVFIEERRPNSNIPSRGRRGRARAPHQAEILGGRFGSRNLGRVGGYSGGGGDREYTKARGNGFYRPSNRQGRAFMGRQSSGGNQDPEE